MNDNNDELEQEEQTIEIEEQPEVEEMPVSHSNRPDNIRQTLSSHSTDDATKRIKDTIASHRQQHLNVNQASNNVSQETDHIENKEQNDLINQTMETAASVGLQAAGVPAPIADVISKKALSQKTIAQKVLEFMGMSASIYENPILSNVVFFGTIGGIVTLLLVTILLMSNGRSVNQKKDIANYLANGVVTENETSESLTNYLEAGGWCKGTIDCMSTPSYQFYYQFRQKIVNKIEEYEDANAVNSCSNTITMTSNDTVLLLATILYDRAEDDLLSSEKLDYWKFEQYINEMDYIIDSMYVQENSCYTISHDHYKDEIIKTGGYIDIYRADLGTSLSKEAKEQIYEEIISESNSYMGVAQNSTDIIGGYAECSGVTVIDKDKNIIGTYSLEEYVAGVVTGEMSSKYPDESLKALAVAARTFVLNDTNSCQKPIESSSNRQNFNPNIKSFGEEAANATAGEVLVDISGKIFSSEYDSWYCKGSNTCTYSKKPNGETHEVTISDKYLSSAAGGHGRGMSQIAAADMADQGSNYQEILSFFYSDGVQIKKLTASSGLLSGNKYASSAPIHSNVNELLNNNFYNKQASNLGQCVWYARSRAQEILYHSNMPDHLKTITMNSIKNTYGNGEAWFRNPDGSIFSKSTDVNQPRAGAIVSWSGGINSCTPNCGHVAIIESVNADGTVTISEGWKSGNWSSNSWSTVNYRKFTATIDYIKYHTNSSGDPYYFNGYVYLLG